MARKSNSIESSAEIVGEIVKSYKPYQQDVTLCKGINDLYPYEVHLPDLPPLEQIINYGLPAEQQIFRRVSMPTKIKALNKVPREDAIAYAEADEELSKWISSMWHKFTYGEFQYINGEPFYIPPTYWFYLNFWNLDTGLPKFRYDKTHFTSDLWEFVFWDLLAQESPVCYGTIEGSKRRGGKTYKAMCKGYKRIISGKKKRGCIQSKSDDDAVDAFVEKMVQPWIELPFFFKPSHSNSSFPKKEGLQFFPKAKRGKVIIDDAVDSDDYLFSYIVAKSSGEKAGDGYKWHVHISDEDGKTPDVDVWDRHVVIKPCLTEEGEVIGKEIAVTTVEDMDKGGGKRFCYKWKMSDRNPNRKKEELTVRENGETVSGLWQWFCPARCNEVWDRFGKAIVDAPTKEESEYLKAKGDPNYMKGGRQRVYERVNSYKKQVDQQKESRKYPEEVRDMFVTVGGFCHFDLSILSDRLKYFAFGYPPEMMDKMTFGNFHWKDGVFGGEVEFIATAQDDARWWISYMPDENNRNKYNTHPVNNKKTPANWHKFCSGADPFKFDTDEVIHKDRMSDAAMIVYAEYDVMVDTPDKNPADYVTGDMCAEYMYRADTVDEMCEDFAKACVFYGMKVFPERNNSDVVRYFKLNGLENYIQFDMQVKKSSEGTFFAETAAGSNTDVKTIQSMFKVVQKYVKDNGLRCKFYRTLEQLKDVSPDNMNPYDLFVAMATCLRVVIEFNPVKLSTQEQDNDDVGDIIGALSPRSFGDEAPNESYGYA